MAMRNLTKLKYPVFTGVEYFDLLQNKQTLKSYSGIQLEGKKWRELSEMIGKEFGNGVYRYTFKFANSDEINNGSIRGIATTKQNNTNPTDNKMQAQIEALQNKVNGLSNNSNNIGVELLISVTKQSYETQITFLNNQLQQKDFSITKLENQIEKLNDELDQCYQTIDELNSKTGMNQYLEIAKDFLKLKNVSKVEKVSLKDSDSSDIPRSIIDLLGIVDWSKVDDNLINEIVKYLNMFIPKLPLK